MVLSIEEKLSIGREIVKLRYEEGLLQRDLAGLIGISLQEIALIELGRYDLNPDILNKISDALKGQLNLRKK